MYSLVEFFVLLECFYVIKYVFGDRQYYTHNFVNMPKSILMMVVHSCFKLNSNGNNKKVNLTRDPYTWINYKLNYIYR